jgi:hypothetical protein
MHQVYLLYSKEKTTTADTTDGKLESIENGKFKSNENGDEEVSDASDSDPDDESQNKTKNGQ